MVKYSLEVYIHNWKKTGLKLQSREYSIEWLNIGLEVYIHIWKKTGLKIQRREHSIEWLNMISNIVKFEIKTINVFCVPYKTSKSGQIEFSL